MTWGEKSRKTAKILFQIKISKSDTHNIPVMQVIFHLYLYFYLRRYECHSKNSYNRLFSLVSWLLTLMNRLWLHSLNTVHRKWNKMHSYHRSGYRIRISTFYKLDRTGIRLNLDLSIEYFFKPPPLLESRFFEEKSKLSFLHRKMQWSFLFQNIDRFLKKDQILQEFRSKLRPYCHVFRHIFVNS